MKRVLVRSGVALLSAVLAIGVPRFGLFINLTGAVCCTFLAFILPVRSFLLVGVLFQKTNSSKKLV